MTSAPASGATPIISSGLLPQALGGSASLHGFSGQSSPFATLLHIASDDSGSDEPARDTQAHATAAAQPIAVTTPSSTPTVQPTVTPVAGFLSWNATAGAFGKSAETTEPEEKSTTSDAKKPDVAAPANTAGASLLMHSIAGLGVPQFAQAVARQQSSGPLSSSKQAGDPDNRVEVEVSSDAPAGAELAETANPQGAVPANATSATALPMSTIRPQVEKPDIRIVAAANAAAVARSSILASGQSAEVVSRVGVGEKSKVTASQAGVPDSSVDVPAANAPISHFPMSAVPVAVRSIPAGKQGADTEAPVELPVTATEAAQPSAPASKQIWMRDSHVEVPESASAVTQASILTSKPIWTKDSQVEVPRNATVAAQPSTPASKPVWTRGSQSEVPESATVVAQPSTPARKQVWTRDSQVQVPQIATAVAGPSAPASKQSWGRDSQVPLSANAVAGQSTPTSQQARVPEGRVAVPASDTPAPDPSISTSQKAAAEPDSGANVPANAIEAVPAVPVPTIQAGRQGSRVDQSTGVIAPSSPLQVVTNVEGIRAKDDAGRSLSASELSGTDAPAQDGDSGTQVAAAPTAGDGNAPLSSSPLAFAARLNALPSDSQQSPPLQQPTAEPQATRSQASQASVQSSPALESNAIQPPAVSQAVQTAPEQTGERAEKFDGQALSATSAAVEQAAAPKTDATHALDRPADVRSADVDQAPPASTNLTAVRDVRLQVSGSDNQRVDVRVMDRGGELRVSVRADDPSLVRSLQDNVGDLSTRLDQARFQSEVWTPRMEAASQTDSANTNGNGRAFSNGGETFGRDGQGQQNGRQQQQPFWVDDFEENPAGSNPGGTKQWQP